jgi:hypothetical protein
MLLIYITFRQRENIFRLKIYQQSIDYKFLVNLKYNLVREIEIRWYPYQVLRFPDTYTRPLFDRLVTNNFSTFLNQQVLNRSHDIVKHCWRWTPIRISISRHVTSTRLMVSSSQHIPLSSRITLHDRCEKVIFLL